MLCVDKLPVEKARLINCEPMLDWASPPSAWVMGEHVEWREPPVGVRQVKLLADGFYWNGDKTKKITENFEAWILKNKLWGV